MFFSNICSGFRIQNVSSEGLIAVMTQSSLSLFSTLASFWLIARVVLKRTARAFIRNRTRLEKPETRLVTSFKQRYLGTIVLIPFTSVGKSWDKELQVHLK